MTVRMILLALIMLAGRGNGGLLKYGFALSIPLMLVGFIALLATIVSFVKMFRDARIAHVPLGENSDVTITKTGDLSLMLQIPVTALYAGHDLDYQLTERESGQNIELHKTSFRSSSRRNSLSTQTFPVRNFRINKTGNYLLQTKGFNPQANYDNYFLIVEEKTNIKSVLYILTLIITGGMTILGFVFTIISLNAGK